MYLQRTSKRSLRYELAILILMLLVFSCFASWFWFSQLPNDLGSALGRGGHIANILVVAKPGQRTVLGISEGRTEIEGGNAFVGFPDKPGIFSHGSNIHLSDEERAAFREVYDALCTKPPRRIRFTGEHFYTMGFSCGASFGKYIEVADSQIPPIVLNLFRRAAAIDPK